MQSFLCPSSIVVGAGEMWVLDNTNQNIFYFGPSDVNSTAVVKSSQITDHAFSVFCNGDFAQAVSILRDELGCGINGVCALRNRSLLHYAVEMKNTEAIQFLVDNGISVKNRSNAAVFAADMGDVQIVSLLIGMKADVNVKQTIGNITGSFLIKSVHNGHKPEIVSLLVSNKANVNYNANGGFTPLWCAGMYFHKIPAVVQILCAAGADVNARNSAGETILYRWIADSFGDDLVSILPVVCRFGCNLDAVCGPEKNTALILAVSRFRLDHIECLVELGADVTIKNALGKTALDVLEDAVISNDGIKTRFNWNRRDTTMVFEFESLKIDRARILLSK
jgi:hypothetical protein